MDDNRWNTNEFQKSSVEDCTKCRYMDPKTEARCHKFKDGKPLDILIGKEKCKELKK